VSHHHAPVAPTATATTAADTSPAVTAGVTVPVLAPLSAAPPAGGGWEEAEGDEDADPVPDWVYEGEAERVAEGELETEAVEVTRVGKGVAETEREEDWEAGRGVLLAEAGSSEHVHDGFGVSGGVKL
jgi:hypothetical protein